MSSSLVSLGFFCSLLAYGPLWARIVREWDKPPHARQPLLKVTWLILTLVDLGLATTADASTALQMWAYVLGSGSIALYALRKGASGWTSEDARVLTLAAAALCAWIVTSGTVATVFLLAAASIGAYSLGKEIWHDPKSQGSIAWWLFWFGGAASLFAMPSWSSAHVIAPAGFFILQSAIVILTLRKGQPVAVTRPVPVLVPRHVPSEAILFRFAA